MIKNIVFIALLIAAIFMYLDRNAFKKEFQFNGDRYSHVKKAYGGDLTNHFYTIEGEDFLKARQFVQIIEFPEEIPKEQFERTVQPVFKEYNLKPFNSDGLERTGSFEKGGYKFVSFSNSVRINDEDHMGFYIAIVEEETSLPDRGHSQEILNELMNLIFE